MRAQEFIITEDPAATADKIELAALDFYKNQVGDVGAQPVDNFRVQAQELLQKATPGIRDKVLAALKKANANPYIQGGVITTVGSLLAGGVLASAQKMGLNPGQTNMLLQAILNTVIPTMVSRVNGKSWRDTLKYTLASAGIGTGIAAITENFADGKVKGKSRPGRVKRTGASCSGSVSDLRSKAKKYGGEKGKMYHWCANMKSGKKK